MGPLQIAPDVNQFSIEQCPDVEQPSTDNSDPRAAINPITKLDILYTNADQLLNKMDDLSTLIAGDEPDLILISEILPKRSINSLSSARLSLYGYQAFFNFDPDSHQTPPAMRGVGIYISNKLIVSEVTFDGYPHHEHVWISIKLMGHDSLLVSCIYRSPSSDTLQSTIGLCKLLTEIDDHTHLLICGDFNYPDIDWSSNCCSNHCSQLFLDTVQDKYLFQHEEAPTRHVQNSTPHILDLILTNEEEMINSVNILPALGLSDHVCLRFNYLCYCSTNPASKPHYNIHQANIVRMRQMLTVIEWEDLLSPLDIQSAYNEFALRLTSIINDCVPFETPRLRKNLFMTRAALHLKNTKCKLWNKYQRSKSPADYQVYCQSRNKLCNLTRSLRRKYEANLASNRTSNIKQFWKYVNSRLKTRPSINSLRRDDNSAADSDQEKCELFNKIFTSVFTKEDCTSIPQYQLDGCHSSLTDITITPAIVFDKLTQLNPNKAPGPEGWPLFCLKECAQELSSPLSFLYNKSLECSVLPKHWKEALITPVHKKGDRSNVSNYRPISLTSPICRILESIIKDNIQDHLMTNNVILPHQHGFTPGRSCSTQLLLAMNDWTKALDDGHSVDILYFDFAKAFDSVPHNRLISKLQGCGISGKLLAWVKNFLVGRKQKVLLNSHASDWSSVSSGVPQGSVLDPILFNIYVSNMPLIVNSPIFQFADDVKMFRTIRTVDDFCQLQQDINLLFA